MERGASILFLLLTGCLALKCVTSKPVEDLSYIEGINFEYKEDKWTCGDVKCPADTFGCKIVLRTPEEEDGKVLYQSFNCIDRDKQVILGAGDRIKLAKAKTINIDVDTYVGAESVYSTSYGMGGHETAKGVIAVDQLAEFKETARSNKKGVDDSNN